MKRGGKSEILISKSETNSKSGKEEKGKRAASCLNSYLNFSHGFGFRISDLTIARREAREIENHLWMEDCRFRIADAYTVSAATSPALSERLTHLLQTFYVVMTTSGLLCLMFKL